MDLKDAFRGQKHVYILAWVLIGFVFAFAVCSMVLSGSTSITSLYDVGSVYEISNYVYRTPNVLENGHQESSGKVVLDSGYYEYIISIEKNQNQYKYFCVQLDDLSLEKVNWTIEFRKQKSDEVVKSVQKSYYLHEGTNLIDVPQNSFNIIVIGISGENHTSFYIEKMELRETRPVFDVKKAFGVFLFSYLIYIFVSGILIFVWHKTGISFDLYSWIDSLQELYIIVADQFRKIQESIPFIQKYKSGLITACFVLMFLYSVRVEILQNYYVRFKYHAVAYSILLLIIAILSMESKLEKKNWNNSLVWSWLILWIMTCASDFLLHKDFRFIGYVMVFVMGFFIFIWNNMKNPGEVVKNFVRAIHIFMILITAFCLIFRPENEGDVGTRYSGFSKNPSIFALYLGSIFAVVLGGLEDSFKRKSDLKFFLLYILEGCVTLAFCWKSQSLCPLLCMLGMAFIWFVRMTYYTKRTNCRKLLVLVVISSAILLIPTYVCIDWSVKHIPQSLGTSISYVGEEPIARQQYGMVVYAGDLKDRIKESRLGQKLSNATLTRILSERDYYYKAYLREMNLFGHKENPTMWGRKRLPHNAVIGIAYRYGIFTSVPYIIMLMMTIIRTIRYSKKKVSYAAVSFYVCLSSIVMSMVDNVEQPFVWLPWLGLYLLMGCVFDNDNLKV